jgi:hypothetical protein
MAKNTKKQKQQEPVKVDPAFKQDTPNPSEQTAEVGTETPPIGQLPNGMIHKKTAAIEVYKVLKQTFVVYIVCIVGPFLTLAFNVFNENVAYGLVAFIAVLASVMIVVVRKRMLQLQMRYGINPKTR